MFYLIAICMVLVSVGGGKVVIACVLCALAGFGLGRVKNAVKLQRVRDLMVNAEQYGSAELRELVADIKSHL